MSPLLSQSLSPMVITHHYQRAHHQKSSPPMVLTIDSPQYRWLSPDQRSQPPIVITPMVNHYHQWSTIITNGHHSLPPSECTHHQRSSPPMFLTIDGPQYRRSSPDQSSQSSMIIITMITSDLTITIINTTLTPSSKYGITSTENSNLTNITYQLISILGDIFRPI